MKSMPIFFHGKSKTTLQKIKNKIFILEKEENWHYFSTLSALISSYLIFSLIRFIATIVFDEPIIFGDELTYRYLSYSFYKYKDFYEFINFGHVSNGNILYQFFISPSFIFGDNFYIVSKLINCLLINSAIFPSYLIMRQFVSRQKAFFSSLLILIIPQLSIANYMLPESLYFPLFLWCFFACFKLLSEFQVKYSILTGILFALLFLTKPTATTLIVSFLITNLLVFICAPKYSINRRKILISLVISTIAFFLMSMILREIFSLSNILGESYSNSGNKFFKNWTLSIFLSTKFLIMATSHLSTFGFLYLLPFLVSLFALFQEIKIKQYQNIVFLTLGLISFILHLLATLKFTVDIAGAENLARLHARYYFMTYPFFIFSFIIFSEKIIWSAKRKLLLFISISLLLFQYIFIFYPNFIQIKCYGFVIDNIAFSCLLLMPKFLMVIALVFLSVTLLYYLVQKNNKLLPFIVFYLVISIFQNAGHINSLYKLHYAGALACRPSRYFIKNTIPSYDEKVLMIGSSILPELNISFWHPYQYVKVLLLPKDTHLSRELISNDVKYIVMFDNYKIDIPYRFIVQKGNCSIISL